MPIGVALVHFAGADFACARAAKEEPGPRPPLHASEQGERARVNCAEITEVGDARLELASELMQENNWTAARREAQRVLCEDPAHPTARVIELAARARLGINQPAVLRELEELAARTDSSCVRGMAVCEAARLQTASGHPDRAYEGLKSVFQNAPDRALYLKSGCLLGSLLKWHPDLASDDALLRAQVLGCESLWDQRLRDECAVPAASRRLRVFSLPGEAVVAFYRACVSPAIGARCSLEPSCSRYFLEASRRHGLLAFPIVADRLVREPGVVSKAARKVVVGNVRKIADPLDDHDFWLSNAGRTGARRP